MERYDLPEGWDWRRLGDQRYFDLIMGQSPPSSSYNLNGVGLPFFQGKAEFGLFHPVAKKYCSAPSRIAEKDDILISVRAPVGPTNLANQKCCMGRGLAVIRCKEEVLPLYLLLALRNVEKDIAASVQDQGGGFTSIKREQLEDVEIPVPPLHEQCCIVGRVEEQNSRLEEINTTHSTFDSDFRAMLLGAYSEISRGAEYKPMADVAPLVRRSVKIIPSDAYLETGIRCFGKGTFPKPALTGTQLGSKRIFRIEEGDLLFNIVFAWEGAVAVAKAEDHGRVGSHRFLTCVPKKQMATSQYLCFHFLTEQGLHDLGDASPGGAGRNRTLGLKALDKIKVPVPSHKKQVWFSKLWTNVNMVKKLGNEMSKELDAFTPALLAKAFRGEL